MLRLQIEKLSRITVKPATTRPSEGRATNSESWPVSYPSSRRPLSSFSRRFPRQFALLVPGEEVSGAVLEGSEVTDTLKRRSHLNLQLENPLPILQFHASPHRLRFLLLQRSQRYSRSRQRRLDHLRGRWRSRSRGCRIWRNDCRRRAKHPLDARAGKILRVRRRDGAGNGQIHAVRRAADRRPYYVRPCAVQRT